MPPRPKRTSDPCRVRYGFWRLHALGLAAVGPVYGGEIRRTLDGWGVQVVPGTLMPALQQMVDAGLLERLPSGGFEKPLRITPKGRQEIADLRPYLVSLTDLVDGKPQLKQRSAPASVPSQKRSSGALAALLAIVRESEASAARIRAAMQQLKNAVDAALSAE